MAPSPSLTNNKNVFSRDDWQLCNLKRQRFQQQDSWPSSPALHFLLLLLLTSLLWTNTYILFCIIIIVIFVDHSSSSSSSRPGKVCSILAAATRRWLTAEQPTVAMQVGMVLFFFLHLWDFEAVFWCLPYGLLKQEGCPVRPHFQSQPHFASYIYFKTVHSQFLLELLVHKVCLILN